MGAVACGSLWGMGFCNKKSSMPCKARLPQSEFTSVPKAERAQRSFSSDLIAQAKRPQRHNVPTP